METPLHVSSSFPLRIKFKTVVQLRIHRIPFSKAREILSREGEAACMVDREEEAQLLSHLLNTRLQLKPRQALKPGDKVLYVDFKTEGVETLLVEVQPEADCLCLTCEYSDECDEHWEKCSTVNCSECVEGRVECSEYECEA